MTNWSRAWHNHAPGYMFLLPWLIGFFGLTIGPIISSLYLSFTDFDLLTPAEWVGTANYERMFTNDRNFAASMRVTLFFVLFSVPLKLAFALGVAMLLNRGMRGLPLYRALFYLPSLIGASVAIAILWRTIFSGDGLVNNFLAMFGIQGPSWISNPNYSLWTLIILAVWQFGSPMIIFLAGLRQIPQDMYEAASLDGAGKWRQFWKITLPLLTPVVFFNAIIQTIEAFKSFTPAFIISGGSGGPINSTLFYTLYLYNEAFAFFRMGYASALAWFLLFLIGCFTAFSFLTSKYWVHYDD
jgi:multiple sugar transport system permease protein